MARITVEDCIGSVENNFQLVLVASKRARQLANGAEAMVPWENDKPTVVALREVAAGHITESILDQPDQSLDELIDAEQEAADLSAEHLSNRSAAPIG